MWNLKYDTNELTYKTDTDSHRKQTMVTKRERGRGDKLGVWDQQTQTTIHKNR